MYIVLKGQISPCKFSIKQDKLNNIDKTKNKETLNEKLIIIDQLNLRK